MMSPAGARFATGFHEHDRFAVSRYVQIVLDRSPYPGGFPSKRHAGYVPESSLLAVEWYLPTFDIIPEQNKARLTEPGLHWGFGSYRVRGRV